jgi:phage terminase large subunit-like protein
VTATVEWQELSVPEKRLLYRRLRPLAWKAQARPDQLPPTGDWQVLLLRGGRGSGKTWAGARILLDEIDHDPVRDSEGPGVWAIVAPTFADARDKCVEGEAGILAALSTTPAEVDAKVSPTVAKWNRSIGELWLHDGTKLVIDGADDGAYRIQGENLRGAWCDEVGLWKKWKASWDESLGFALRKGRARRIATGTPKRDQPARKLIRRLLADPTVVDRRLRTVDNLEHLSESFRRTQIDPYVGTELGRQEIEGELLEDAEGALWSREWIEELRVPGPPGRWQRAPIVGVDPSDGTEDGAEHAYTVSALAYDHELYVVEHDAMRGSVYQFACHVVRTASAHHGIVHLEKNHGGAWLVEVFERAMRDLGLSVPLKVIHAAEGKRTRAEPIAALYEPRVDAAGNVVRRGRVHHCDVFPELEDQMCNWSGLPNEKSPDRLDSLVWSLHDFTDLSFMPVNEFLNPESAVPYTEKRIDEGAVAWS